MSDISQTGNHIKIYVLQYPCKFLGISNPCKFLGISNKVQDNFNGMGDVSYYWEINCSVNI